MLTLIVVFMLQLWAQDVPEKPADFNEIRRISEAFTNMGYVHPGIGVVYEIYRAEQREGAQLRVPEVISLAMDLLEKRGGALKIEKFCFTCHMRVLTPDGDRMISELRVGDIVLSWNFRTDTLVSNEIVEIFESENRAFGILRTPISRNGAIEVTPEHPFYTPDLAGFFPIGEISRFSHLQGVTGHPPVCKTVFGPRGSFKMQGHGTVRTLKLKDSPHNFIVEGVLVHNKTIVSF